MVKIGYLIPHYIVWHFTKAFADAFGVWKNFLWFVWRFFSISKLSKTLFSPWERMNEEYGKDFSLENTLGVFVVNTVMRLFGAVLRIFVITFGLFVWLVVFFAGLVFFVAWLFLPLIIIVLFVFGIANLF
jgi:hypothetical protein